MRASTPRQRALRPGRWPVATVSVLAVTTVLTVLQYPPDAGASVAAAGLLGAVSAWLLSPAGPRQLQVRVWGVFWPLVGIYLTLKQDHHGPPLLVGFAVGALLLWLDRRRQLSDMVAATGSR
jgi:Na+/H+ antiporter NhaD/arsenite permease-like protein